MKIEQLLQGAGQYGTPLYIYDTDILRDTVSMLRRTADGKAGLCYAMKANPFLTSLMSELADRVEVCSMGEFRICREQNIPPEKILISGVLKKTEDLAEILECFGGKCLYTAESEGQYMQIAKWSGDRKEKIKLFLRLTSGNQFGMDENTVSRLIQDCESRPYLQIQGIHYFSGTQKKRSRQKQELMWLDQYLTGLESRTGCRITELEYGPGLSVNYFQGMDDNTEKDMEELIRVMSGMTWDGRVTLEMGRAFTAYCGYYLTTVKDIKSDGKNRYCIADGGIHQLNYDGQIRGMYCPYLKKLPDAESETTETWTICGSLCTVNDILVRKAELAEVKKGDLIVFERTGAYCASEGMALFLCHELPAAAFYSRAEGFRIVRKPEETYKWNMEERQNGQNN